MENALYYTFSTIAQALAAAVAILGAFVLYRIQSLNTDTHDAAAAVRTHSSTPAAITIQITDAFGRGRYAEVLSLSRQNQQHAAGVDLTSAWHRLETSLASKNSLTATFMVALVLSFVVVLGSVAILAFTPRIVARSYPMVWLVGGVLASGGCLVSYAWLLIRQLR